MKLGICINGYYKGQLFDVELPRGAWIHSSVEHISGFKEEDFDFDENHLVDYLLEHRHSWGIYLPESICKKLEKKINPNDEWLNRKLNWIIRYCNYDTKR